MDVVVTHKHILYKQAKFLNKGSLLTSSAAGLLPSLTSPGCQTEVTVANSVRNPTRFLLFVRSLILYDLSPVAFAKND